MVASCDRYRSFPVSHKMIKTPSMQPTLPVPSIVAKLKDAGLRPTRQRLLLAKQLFGKGARHVSAEELHLEAIAGRTPVSIATIYNALRQFTAAGLLREIMVGPGRTYFDTTTTPHQHYFIESEGRLMDIPDEKIISLQAPEPPPGMLVTRVDLIVRVASIIR
jgi:Fur family iron response transcriptional regulator